MMQNRRKHSPIRRFIGHIFLIIFLYLVFLIVGGVIPFIKQKDVSQTYKESLKTDTFYKDGTSVDRAAIIETSTEAMDIRLRMIASAKKQILFTTFSIKPDEAGQKICAALFDAAERGVKVDILIDGLSGSYDMKYDPMFYTLGTHENVTIKYYNFFHLYTPWRFNGRLHDKFIVIDNNQMLLGGRNTSNYFLGAYDQKVLSYDREVYVYNTAKTPKKSVILQTQYYFKKLWECKESKIYYDRVPKRKKEKVLLAGIDFKNTMEVLLKDRPELFEPMDYEAYTMPVNHIELISNPINIMSKEPKVWYTLQQLMLGARSQVMIQTPYMVLNDTMYEGLTEIGKDLDDYEVLLNGMAVGDNICASSDYKFGRKKILKTGIGVYEFQGDHSTHNKSVVIDHRLSAVGSFNFDMRSTYLDTETMLVIDGKEFAAALESNIRDMQKDSIHILKDGSYDPESKVAPKQMSSKKKFLFSFLPYVLRPIRFLL